MDHARRPLSVRSQAWPAYLAKAAAAASITPNQISLCSVFFAALAGATILLRPRSSLWLVAAACCIQLRLLCNLIDGLVAVECGQRTKSGEIFNDLPDRFSDVIILVVCGYSLGADWQGPMLGWFAGTLAVLTAYVRVLGGALGLRQEFTGPMAKQHRMAVMTAACIVGATEQPLAGTSYTLWTALVLISAGSLWTIFRRLARIIQQLEQR